MTGWAPRVFWTAALPEAVEGGFTVRLDGRAVKTPAKAPFVVPTHAMAAAAAAEWAEQEKTVRPETMPVTRAANSAIDKVTAQFDAIVDLLAAYGDSDLLCYRATVPPELIARQAAAWDPLLDWAGAALGAPLRATAGVMHIDQPPESLTRLRALIAAMTPFELAAFHDLVGISGSLVLALAVTRGRLTAEAAWDASRVDDIWQIEQWGEDEEAAAAESFRRQGFMDAARFWGLCR